MKWGYRERESGSESTVVILDTKHDYSCFPKISKGFELQLGTELQPAIPEHLYPATLHTSVWV